MSHRDPNIDLLKEGVGLRNARKSRCTLPDCNKFLTAYQGPGSDTLCRNHQKEQAEYGGYGKINRPHSFHRNDVCNCCGQNIEDDPRWLKAETFFGIVLSDKQRNEIKRRYNHGDHEHRKSDGGDDTSDNTNPYCSFCHWVKTVINNDGRKGDLFTENA